MNAALLLTAALAAAQAPGQRIAATAIEQAVQTHVAAELARAGSAARASITGRIDDQAVGAGTPAIEVGAIAGRFPRARVGVPVRLTVDGRLARALTVWVELHDPRTAWTYAQSYDARSDAASLALSQQIVDVVCCPGERIATPEQVRGLRTARAVQAGQPARVEDFEAAPDVAARQRVVIEVQSGAVRLQTQGVALRDGRVGERIAVRPEHAQETVAARVVAPAKVVIDE